MSKNRKRQSKGSYAERTKIQRKRTFTETVRSERKWPKKADQKQISA